MLYAYCRHCRKRKQGFLLSIIVLNVFILMCLEGLKSSIIIIYGLPIYLGNGPFLCLLNNSMTGLGNPIPMGIGLIWNKVRVTSLWLSRHFYWAVHKYYACFNLSLALVVIWWCNGLFYIHLSAKLFKCIQCEVCTYIWREFLWKSNSMKTIIAALTRSSAVRLSAFFITGNLL